MMVMMMLIMIGNIIPILTLMLMIIVMIVVDSSSSSKSSRGAWWLICRLGAFRPTGRRFESRSSRHRTLNVALHGVSGAHLSGSGLEEAL